MIERCCAFTGHRPRKFPWGYNEADARCVALKETLAREIAKLVNAGYKDFLFFKRRLDTKHSHNFQI